MTLDPSAFGYLKPTDKQIGTMGSARVAAWRYAQILGVLLPEGPDKTYVLRMLRTVSMWAMVAITRHPDGSPREENNEPAVD